MSAFARLFGLEPSDTVTVDRAWYDRAKRALEDVPSGFGCICAPGAERHFVSTSGGPTFLPQRGCYACDRWIDPVKCAK